MQTRKADCKHGAFEFYAGDEFVGRSLELYGDYSEDECSVFRMVLRPNDIAVEVGSNIGALTVPMARLCKKVYAFEPQPENFELLNRNLAANGIENVEVFDVALGADNQKVVCISRLDQLGHKNFGRVEIEMKDDRRSRVTYVDMMQLDHMVGSDKIKFIKIDVEGSELDVLKGAQRIIERNRPILYVENDREEKSAELVGWLLDHGYRCFWHRPPLYHASNHRKQTVNVFGGIVSLNMVCAHEDSGIEIDRLEEVADARVDHLMYQRERDRALRQIARKPGDAEAMFKAAHYANLNGEHAAAREMLDKALALQPDHIGCQAVRGLFALQDGDFIRGWPAYELRYKQKVAHGFGYRPHDAPHWDGTPTSERVLIWCEQGFGDTIMFIRFCDEVLRRAPNAFFEVQPQLFELIETSGIIPPGQLFRLGRTMPTYAYHCSIPSLPATLGLTTEKQLYSRPYLRADKAMVASWLKRDTPRIGLCLKGGLASERAYSRDMPEEAIMRVADRFGPFMSLVQEGQWESYADTAAAISSLNLVLTVDTSVAHLSGALGVPTLLMLSSDPDWRWQLGREDSSWYPSMRIFRQRDFMDWTPVVEAVERVLEGAKRQAA